MQPQKTPTLQTRSSTPQAMLAGWLPWGQLLQDWTEVPSATGQWSVGWARRIHLAMPACTAKLALQFAWQSGRHTARQTRHQSNACICFRSAVSNKAFHFSAAANVLITEIISQAQPLLFLFTLWWETHVPFWNAAIAFSFDAHFRTSQQQLSNVPLEPAARYPSVSKENQIWSKPVQ